MANTTNYNWETPDDTDLVKDGAAAIRTLGSSIDTTTKNLNPQTTTGAIAYRSATANVNTALPIGTANQVLRVNSGGTAPEWATTADQTPLTTKGDLFGFDTADARIPIGTNGYILTADSTQSLGLKWAAPAAGSGLTLVTKSSFSAVTSHSLNSCFSATYDFYEVKIAFTASSGAPDFTIRLRASGTDDSADYAGTTIYAFGTTLGSNSNNSLGTDEFFVGGSGSTTANYTGINAQICNPFKSQVTTLFADSSYGTSNVFNFQNIGYHNDAGSFDGFTLLASTGTMTGTIYVYGLAV